MRLLLFYSLFTKIFFFPTAQFLKPVLFEEHKKKYKIKLQCFIKLQLDTYTKKSFKSV